MLELFAFFLTKGSVIARASGGNIILRAFYRVKGCKEYSSCQASLGSVGIPRPDLGGIFAGKRLDDGNAWPTIRRIAALFIGLFGELREREALPAKFTLL